MTMFIYGMLAMSAIATISMWMADNDIIRVICAGPFGWLSALLAITANRILYPHERHNRK